MIEVSVVDGPTDNTARGPLRALYNWLTGATPPPQPPLAGHAVAGRPTPTRLGHYAIVRTLGSGGMGVVYEARDERLERAVALKTMSVPANDETARKRFWREARAAAGVNHPNVCQVYEIGEDQGELFIAMELLSGESLADRLARGPIAVNETTSIGLGMLAALSALHSRGIVHRDLKPSNVFLTPHGVKLLDFGLARPTLEPAMDTKTDLTRAGSMLGTPRYMAPEQVTGEEIDARTDLFSAATILFEMLAGRPAFVGRTVIEILHATVYEQPPALSGSPAVASLDRVIRRALAKKPADRPPSADVMSNELSGLRAASDDDMPAVAQPLTRLVVLPFRVLRFDPETDFLAFSLPDAITTSLTGIGSLIVRSSATAAKFAATEAPDLKTVASEADVDRVVTGTLLRSGDQLRVVTQLIEAPSGTLITSHTVQAPLGDLFRLQDDVTRQIVGALSLPLAGSMPSPAADAPHSAGAYEAYLRANELARTYEKIVEARALYERCVELDPTFAPAWARLGRCYRVIDKYIEHTPDGSARAEAALRRALELNPRLSVAHKFLSNFEADTGKAEQAVVRLLGEATRHGNDPELFAGLVQACRYAGLYDESIAAHIEARRLDPNIPTSVEQSVLMTADYDRVLAWPEPATGGGDSVIRVIALGMSGRLDEALEGLAKLRASPHIRTFREWGSQLQLWLERDPKLFSDLGRLRELSIFEDPEANFQTGWLLADAGQHERALEPLRRAIDRGYFAVQTLERAPQFDALRDNATFQQIVGDAARGRDHALAAFRDAGGDRLLGR